MRPAIITELMRFLVVCIDIHTSFGRFGPALEFGEAASSAAASSSHTCAHTCSKLRLETGQRTGACAAEYINRP